MTLARLEPRMKRSRLKSGQFSRWVTTAAAAEYLGVHITTVREWAGRGRVKCYRTPGGHRRFDLADLERFVVERSEERA